jgi:cytochrome c oxidase subunit 2
MSAMTRQSALRTLACVFAIVFVNSAIAADPPVIPADKFVYCTVCHGVQLGGNAVIRAPRLSDLPPWYVERQLDAFRKGWRGTHPADTGGNEMRPMASVLTDSDIAQAVRYVADVDSPAPVLTVDGDEQRGELLYASCSACHGANAQGNEALASPALTGLNDWYLLTQLENFQAGVRGSEPGDTHGLQMQAATRLLPDNQAMKDVIRYISTLANQ